MSRLKGHLFPKGWFKNNQGYGAMTGTLWTLLAREGFPGAHTVLDGEGDFWRLAGSDRCDYQTIVEGFGKKFHIMGVAFKPYPACRWAHSTIEAFGSIVEDNSLDRDDIETVRVSCFKGAEQSNRHPQDMIDASFSIPHLLAMVALGKPPVDWLLQENISDPKAQKIAEKVTVETGQEAERLFARSQGKVLLSNVEVRTRAGDTFSCRVLYPKGTPGQKPLTEEDLLQKFDELTYKLITAPARRSVLDLLIHLEEVDHVSEVTSALAVNTA
jgi:2-methylcitrate dehydratase PrpD